MQQGHELSPFVQQEQQQQYPTFTPIPSPSTTGAEGSVPLIYTGVQYPTYYQPSQQQQPTQLYPQAFPASSGASKCVNCGTANDAMFKFCSNCGTQLPAGDASSIQQQQPLQQQPLETTAKESSFWGRFKVWSVTGIITLAVAVNALLITIWLFAGHGFPWFIYPLAGSFAVASFVYVISYLQERKLLTLHFLLSINLNIVLMCTYVFAFTGYPWFIHALFPTLALFALHYLVEQYRDPEWTGTLSELLFKIHLFSVYIPLNTMLFITFVGSDPEEPWFLYPLIITSFPVLCQYIFTYHSEDPRKWFLAHFALYCHTNLFFFIVWYLAGHGFPWFVILLGLFTALLLLHYGLHFHRAQMGTHFDKIEKVGMHTMNRVGSTLKEPVGGMIHNVQGAVTTAFSSSSTNEKETVTNV